MSKRVEFGSVRSVCGCPACTEPCRHMPGYLIPDDLARMGYDRGDDLLRAKAERELAASPGPLLGRLHPDDGRLLLFRQPTLVPQSDPRGRCRHFRGGRCGIHAAAPFGCAFFRMCSPPEEHAAEAALSHRGIMAVLRDWERPDSLYRHLWEHLHRAGLVVEPVEVRRARMGRAFEEGGGL
jgi:hypothetical protein